MNEFKTNDDDLVFERALAIENPDERNAFVLASCNHDDKRAQFISRLIDSHFSSSEFMKDPASDVREGHSSTESSLNGEILCSQIVDKPGDFIGAFELLEEVGRGGMAIVFRARQSAPIQREVAIKIIKPGLETEQIINRMNLERQTTASMNHPGIAAVYDAGLSPLGRPYFVMEFVEGESITKFFRQRDLSQRQQVELFLGVCQAVHHAHQRGIIHRDLKPSNILVVESDGRPFSKVIDFGIAKLLDPELNANETLTTHGQIVGTPQYMSPEQAVNGQKIDTRSDIYSLGAVLYELLSGQPPFQSETLAGTLDRVVGEEPVALTSLNKSIPKDLATICHCCLQKDVEQRYESVQSLADDLSCFLSGRPIRARKIGAAHRLWKWAHRSQAAACLVLVSLAAIIALVTLWATFTIRLKDQRDKIQRSAQLLEAGRNSANDNFFQAHKAIRKYLNAVQTHTPLGSSHDLMYQQELIESGLEFYDELLANRDSARATISSSEQLAEIQLEQISLTMEYGKVLLIARDEERSVASFNKALKMLDSIRGSAIHDADKINLKSGSISISIARTYLQAGDRENAEQASRQAIAFLEDVSDNGSGASMRDWSLANAWRRLGDVQLAKRNMDDAETSYRQALEYARQLSNIFDFQLTHASCRLSLGAYFRKTGSIEEATKAVKSALQIIEDVCVRCSPTFPRYDLKRVSCLAELARCQHAEGNAALAVSTLEMAIQLKEDLRSENPGVEQIELELASLYEQKGDWSTDVEARDGAFLQASQIVEQFESRKKSPAEVQIQARMFLSAALRAQEKFDLERACERWLKALDLVNQIEPGFQSTRTNGLRAGIHHSLARAYFALEDYERAVFYYSAYRRDGTKTLVADRLLFAVCLAETNRHVDATAEIATAHSELQNMHIQSPLAESVYVPLVRLHSLCKSRLPDSDQQIQNILTKAKGSLEFGESSDLLHCLHQAFALCRMIELLEESPDGNDRYASFISWAELTAFKSIKCACREENPNGVQAIFNDSRISILERLPALVQLKDNMNTPY